MKAQKEAEKEARKLQQEQSKLSKKKSLIVVLHYKSASKVVPKSVRFVDVQEVELEKEGYQMAETRTRKISLPQRYKTN